MESAIIFFKGVSKTEMNEIEYVFNSDIQEKKRTARGSYHKVCGSKSKKCTLPFESMKRKEREKMNGDVMNYKLSEFYTWEQFLAMPSDIQVEYINRMSEYYGVGLSTLSMILFGKKGDQALKKHFEKANLLGQLRVTSHRGAQAGRVRLVEDMRRAEQNRIEIPSTKELAADAKKSVITIGERRMEHVNEIKQHHDELVEETRNLSESGLSNKEIADKFDIPESTVRNYLPQTTGFAQVSQPSYLRDLMLEMDGFDLEVLQFLANKYASKKIKLTVTVAMVE